MSKDLLDNNDIEANNSSNDTEKEINIGEIFSSDDDSPSAEELAANKKALKKEKKAMKKAEKLKKNEGNSDNIESKKKSKKKSRKKSKKDVKPEEINIVKELLSLIVYIGIVVIACFLIITYVGCRSLVDGTSMEPTLQNEDNIWVDKLSYTFGDPERFDVIVFYYDEETTYIKRIIGLPGETVRIDQNGNIFINDLLLKEDYGKERIFPSNIGRASQTILLGNDEYFVLGDNRNNSQDSRLSSVGNVHRDDILGKAVFRIYPLRTMGVVK